MSLLAKIVEGKNLSFEEAYELFNELKESGEALIGGPTWLHSRPRATPAKSSRAWRGQ